MGRDPADDLVVPKKGPISERHRKWIDRYFENNFNAYEAAQFCEYKIPRDASYRIPRRPEVAYEIQRRKRLIAKRSETTVARLVQELDDIALATLDDFLEFYSEIDGKTGAAVQRARVKSWDEIPKRAKVAVKEIEIDDSGIARIKFHDKLRAIEAAMRYREALPPSTEVQLSDTDRALLERLLPAYVMEDLPDDAG